MCALQILAVVDEHTDQVFIEQPRQYFHHVACVGNRLLANPLHLLRQGQAPLRGFKVEIICRLLAQFGQKLIKHKVEDGSKDDSGDLEKQHRSEVLVCTIDV